MRPICLSAARRPPIPLLTVDGCSEGATQFKEFFPVPVVPMTYFLDPGGVPLATITGGDETPKDTLIAKLKEAIDVLSSPPPSLPPAHAGHLQKHTKKQAAVGTASLSPPPLEERVAMCPPEFPPSSVEMGKECE